MQSHFYKLQRGQAQPHVYKDDIEKVKIPILNKNTSILILNKIEQLEENAKKIVINELDKKIEQIIKSFLK